VPARAAFDENYALQAGKSRRCSVNALLIAIERARSAGFAD